VLSYDTDGKGIQTTTSSASAWPMSMPPWRRLASTCVQPTIPPLAGRRHDHRSRPLRASVGHQGSGNQVRRPLRRGALSAQCAARLPRLAVTPRHAFMIT
jgi:hypothetical protein